MPECDDIKFYATAETFGGEKPVPSCMPGTTSVPDVLHEVEEQYETPQDIPMLRFRVWSREQAAY